MKPTPVLLVAILFFAGIATESIYAQSAIDTCIVYGHVYNPDLSPKAGAIIYTKRIIKSGPLWSQAQAADTADASGYIEIVLPRDCIAYLYGAVHGLSSYPGVGTPLTIPDTNTIPLGSLVVATNVPNTYVLALTGSTDTSGTWHASRTDNPHGVTPLQIGAVAKQDTIFLDNKIGRVEAKRDTTGKAERGLLRTDIDANTAGIADLMNLPDGKIWMGNASNIRTLYDLDSLIAANAGSGGIPEDSLWHYNVSGGVRPKTDNLNFLFEAAEMHLKTLIVDSVVFRNTKVNDFTWDVLEPDTLDYHVDLLATPSAHSSWSRKKGLILISLRGYVGSLTKAAAYRLVADSSNGVRIASIHTYVTGTRVYNPSYPDDASTQFVRFTPAYNLFSAAGGWKAEALYGNPGVTNSNIQVVVHNNPPAGGGGSWSQVSFYHTRNNGQEFSEQILIEFHMPTANTSGYYVKIEPIDV